MSNYNGYPNWTQWNVSLWINNDEGLYSMARDCVRACRKSKDDAARAMLESLQEIGVTQTPDGAKYSLTAIKRAMVGM